VNPISFIAVVILILMTLGWVRSKPKEHRRRAWLQAGLITLALVMLFLAITGRMHWLGALIAGLLPFVKSAFPWLLRLLPFLKTRRQQQQNSPKPSGNPSKQEAYEILGLKEGASKEEILAAHKRLMQKAHPDRGGSDWLASRINSAKETLLKD
jgi:hypothetical protein